MCGFCREVLLVIMIELASEFCDGHEVLPCGCGEKFCWLVGLDVFGGDDCGRFGRVSFPFYKLHKFRLAPIVNPNCEPLMANFAKGYGKGNWGWRILRCLADTRRMEASLCPQAADARYKGFWRGKGFCRTFRAMSSWRRCF